MANTGTIRGDFALAVGRNICHGSDSVENAEKEIQLYVPRSMLCRHFSHALVAGSLRASSSTTTTRRRGSSNKRFS